MIFKEIPGYGGKYSVSDTGVVRNNFTNKIRKQHKNRGGYFQVCIKPGDNYLLAQRVHRLVLLAFIGPCPDGHEGDHINRNREDNRLENLRYCDISTGRQNMKEDAPESGFRGVYVRKKMRLSNPWRAKLQFRGAQIWSAYVSTAREAAEIYDKMAIEYFGPLARTNKKMGLL